MRWGNSHTRWIRTRKESRYLRFFPSWNRLHFSFPLGYDSKGRHEPREKTGESKDKRWKIARGENMYSSHKNWFIQLEKHRTLYCRYVFGIYPLKIEKVEGDENDVYCMRNGRLPSTLLSSLNHPHSLPHLIPHPSSLALLVFSSHLVRLLSHILDLPLPCEVSFSHKHNMTIYCFPVNRSFSYLYKWSFPFSMD